MATCTEGWGDPPSALGRARGPRNPLGRAAMLSSRKCLCVCACAPRCPRFSPAVCAALLSEWRVRASCGRRGRLRAAGQQRSAARGQARATQWVASARYRRRPSDDTWRRDHLRAHLFYRLRRNEAPILVSPFTGLPGHRGNVAHEPRLQAAEAGSRPTAGTACALGAEGGPAQPASSSLASCMSAQFAAPGGEHFSLCASWTP